MRLFKDLSPADKNYHNLIASGLIVGKTYRFKPAMKALPLTRWRQGSPYYAIPIELYYGEFIRWRCWPSEFQDCLFLVQLRDVVDPAEEGCLEFLVSVLFTRCVRRPRLV